MIRKLVSIIPIFLFSLTLTTLAQVKIGYMNTQEVLNQLPEKVEIEKKLNSFVQQKQQELADQTAKFQDAVAQYQDNKASMSEQQVKTREEELAQTENELVQLQQSMQSEIQQERAQLLQPVYNRIDEAITAVAEEMDLDFVLNKSTGMGENIIYFGQEQLDVTQEVTDRVKNN